MLTKSDKYLYDLIQNIRFDGYKDENPRPKYKDETPAHTFSINHQVRKYDISAGEFPITTLRPIAWKSAIKEILWIYQDQSNDLTLLRNKYGVRYWDEWESKAMPNTIGARYGEVVRKYNLMNKLLDGLKNEPFGRRHIIDLYQYKELESTDGLNPCAFCTIWNVRKVADKKLFNKDDEKYIYYLDLLLIQRSGDAIAASCSGVNEIQYTALLMMVARHCGYEVGTLTHVVANEQIYDRHLEQANELVNRYEKEKEKIAVKNRLYNKEETDSILKEIYFKPTPRLVLNTSKTNFYDFNIFDFEMVYYNPIKPQLKFELGI